MERSDVTFESGGVQCAAWLYKPDGEGSHPIMVMGHGFTAVREQRLDASAERFASGGIGVLLFDYRFFGASAGEPRQLVDIKAQLEDWRQAIAFARTVPWADQTRLALFGSSLGGGHAVTVAAGDTAVAAVIAQCPFQDGIATLRALGMRTIARLSGHALLDQMCAIAGRPPHYVPAVSATGGLSVIPSDEARDGYASISPPGSTWVNQVAARIGLHVGLYRPGKLAASLQCPALWSIADRDSICPAEVTAKLAAAAPRGEIKRYPAGHFEIYLGEVWENVVEDQLTFLQSNLLSTAVVGGALPGRTNGEVPRPRPA